MAETKDAGSPKKGGLLHNAGIFDALSREQTFSLLDDATDRLDATHTGQPSSRKLVRTLHDLERTAAALAADIKRVRGEL